MRKKRPAAPSAEQIEELLEVMKRELPEDAYQQLGAVVRSYAYLLELLRDKTMTARRLREMVLRAVRKSGDAGEQGEARAEPPRSEAGGSEAEVPPAGLPSQKSSEQESESRQGHREP